MKRDTHERADDELWASFCEGGDQAVAMARYSAAVARADALGFTYRHLPSILAEEGGSAILSRLRALQEVKPGSVEETAILGGITSPGVSIQQALATFVDEIVNDEQTGKSPGQYKIWLAKWNLAVNNFVAICGPRNIHDITRGDALTFYNWWREKIAPDRKSGKTATHSPCSGNRQIGILRKLYRCYFLHMGAGEAEIRNPFDNLSFAERKRPSDEKLRLSFTTEWIVERILAVGALAGLNDEARAIVLTLVETGCRPSEVANLEPKNIQLSAPIPYIEIRPNLDPDNPREIKTASSVRDIPLLGVSLEAMRKFPEGFPRYKDKGNSLSATLNKYFWENGLFPTENHVIYSFRHSFEDRMKHVKADVEMRKILMGHGLDRPQYGDGGLEWKREELARMALPFDPSIV